MWFAFLMVGLLIGVYAMDAHDPDPQTMGFILSMTSIIIAGIIAAKKTK